MAPYRVTEVCLQPRTRFISNISIKSKIFSNTANNQNNNREGVGVGYHHPRVARCRGGIRLRVLPRVKTATQSILYNNSFFFSL